MAGNRDAPIRDASPGYCSTFWMLCGDHPQSPSAAWCFWVSRRSSQIRKAARHKQNPGSAHPAGSPAGSLAPCIHYGGVRYRVPRTPHQSANSSTQTNCTKTQAKAPVSRPNPQYPEQDEPDAVGSGTLQMDLWTLESCLVRGRESFLCFCGQWEEESVEVEGRKVR